jgi:catechol 2,3-dioxygenase-like lactoylglutathione lyase family enzyme
MLGGMNDFAVQQIDHVELYVPDQKVAAAWYARVFGLRILDQYTHWMDGGGPLMVATRDAQTKLALFAGEPLETPPRGAFRRVAFRVDAPGFVDFLGRVEALDLATETGAAVGRTDWVDHGAAFSIYFVDPWHHRFELTTYEVARVRELLE